MTLKLADDLSLPDTYVTSTGALLAVRGAGKSNTAAVMAEEMFARKLPFVVIDPVGAWWGLRSDSDGQRPGLSIPIFGGKRGDLPLERSAGELVADLVVDQRLSCVLDLSQFGSEGDKKHFLLAFAKRLFQRNEDPLHLFLEEADDYIPQKPMRDELQLVRAFENIVRRGRGRGLGITLITQRSAVINKNVLTQVETLFAMRTTGPQDIAAIEAWVKYHQVGTEVLQSLAALDDGEAWVWSPHFLKTMARVLIRRRWTFDSGATPKNVKAGQERRVATLADVDLDVLRDQMAETVQKAVENDPAALKARIRELENIVKADSVPCTVTERIEIPVVSERDMAYIEGVQGSVEAALSGLQSNQVALDNMLAELRAIKGRIALLISVQTNTNTRRPVMAADAVRQAARRVERAKPVARKTDGTIDGAQQKILDTVAMLNERGLTANREMVARWLDIHPNGGRYGSNLARLRELGYLEGCELTEKGLMASSKPRLGLEAVKEPLDGAQRAIVDTLDLNRGKRFSRETLAKVLGLHPNGGRYGSNLARLRTMGLIPERGDIYLTEAAYR
jgi:uncharacterized protein